jgi:hypothetical protein
LPHGLTPVTVYKNVYVPSSVNPLAVTEAAFAEGLNVTVAPVGFVCTVHVPTDVPVPVNAAVVAVEIV